MSEYVSPSRRRMIEDMTVRNLSATTQTSYIHNIKKFSQYFGRSPDRLGLDDVRAYQVYLVSRGVAWATLNQVVSSLRFFFGVTLGRKDVPERIAHALFTLAQRPRSDFRRTKKLLCLTGMPPISHIPDYKGQRPPG